MSAICAKCSEIIPGHADKCFRCGTSKGVRMISASVAEPEVEQAAAQLEGVTVVTHGAKAFTENLSPSDLAFFQTVTASKFSDQAVAFLNAYWPEVGSQAPFIFEVAYEVIQQCEMRNKGINYRHQYVEGTTLDFNIGLFFYEQLVIKVLESPEGARWRENPEFKPSMPESQTALVRKQELRDKVDVDFDGKISFLEYLLYQYKDYCTPQDFVTRSQNKREITAEDSDALAKARAALADVNAAIRAYQAEKFRLEEASEGEGVKALAAKNQLLQLLSGPLAEKLQAALIKAEAAVRSATKALQGGGAKKDEEKKEASPTQGSVFWMNAELAAQKSTVGRLE